MTLLLDIPEVESHLAHNSYELPGQPRPKMARLCKGAA